METLLDTLNDSSTAWLLAQHRVQLGRNSANGITLFYAESHDDLHRWPGFCFYWRMWQKSEMRPRSFVTLTGCKQMGGVRLGILR